MLKHGVLLTKFDHTHLRFAYFQDGHQIHEIANISKIFLFDTLFYSKSLGLCPKMVLVYGFGGNVQRLLPFHCNKCP